MLNITISGDGPDFRAVLAAVLASLPPETEVREAAGDYHLTKPLISAPQQPQVTGGAFAPPQQEPKSRGGRKPKDAANPFTAPAAAPAAGGPFGAPAAAPQPAAVGGPFGAPQTTAAPASNGAVLTVEAVQEAITGLFARGKGAAVPGLLQSFGATNSSTVAPERRADFIAAAAVI